MPEGDAFTIDAYDKYIGAQLDMPLMDAMANATVKARKRDHEGNPIGSSNANPLLDTRVYEVEFADGTIDDYAANVIAENMYAQVDDEGRQFNILEELVDHRKDETALEGEPYVTIHGRQHPKRTTIGWQICVKWKDGSTSWENLKDLKEANPIETAEYAVAHSLTSEPAFSWWVTHTLKKRDRIISAVRARFVRKEYKFGLKVPNTIAEARRIDAENGDLYWERSVEKEMKNVRVAFKVLDNDKNVPVGYLQIPCRLLFDVKLDFTRKTRLVAGGHVTDPPSIITYASVVSRESVRIALLIAALNDLDVMGADISNAYLTAPTTERVWTVLGAEWGADAGRRAIIVRALYGLKSSGAAYRNHLASYLREELKFESCLADPDVWLRLAAKEDGEEYYEYLLVYVDDLLAISEHPKVILDDINSYFHLKPESVGPPDLYLGAKLSKATMNNGVEAWCNSSHRYVQEAIKNTEKYLQQNGNKMLRKKTTCPMDQHYRPELDCSPILPPDKANYYQSQLGILRWIVELGRIDIATEVSMLAAHNALPREGHLGAAFRIYSYLKTRPNARLIFDPTYADIDYESFPHENWSEFYGDVAEAIPPNAPRPLGKGLECRCYVDADHAGDKVTRRSRTGIIIYLNSAPIVWYTKKQNTVETSTFGSEFVALKTATEMLRGLRYKLRMMGIPIDGPTYIYCDNNSVVVNSSSPASTLKKKSNSIAYHCVRDSVARDEQRVTYESTHTNLADLLTKPLPGGTHRDYLISQVLFDIVPAAAMA
jgi:hypothetical protein